MPCAICQRPGDCEDCLDCLYWPDVVDDGPPTPPIPRGVSVPSMADELASARAELTLGQRIGLEVRGYRRRHGLTQRALGESVGWSRAAIGRLEVDAAGTPFARVEALVAHLGYRLAIVAPGAGADPEEPADTRWGAPDLLAADRRGRRPPPFARVTWQPPWDRDPRTGRGHVPEWTWSRPPLTPPDG